MIIKTKDPTESEIAINNEVSFTINHISYKQIHNKIFPYGLSLFLVFFITVLTYPSITVLIESQGKGNGHLWNGQFYS